MDIGEGYLTGIEKNIEYDGSESKMGTVECRL